MCLAANGVRADQLRDVSGGPGHSRPGFVRPSSVSGEVGGEDVAFGHCLHLKVPCPPRHVSAVQHDDGLAFARAVLQRIRRQNCRRVEGLQDRCGIESVHAPSDFGIYRFLAVLKAFRVYGVCGIRWFARHVFL